MDAAQALADLAEISSQIDVAVLLTADGVVLGATIDDEARAARLGEGALRLLQEAPSGPDGSAPAQLEATTPHGGVFVVREAGRTIVATTGPEPTVGLVFYDLKTCLRSAAEEPEETQPKPKARRSRKQAETGSEAGGAA